MYIYIDCMYVSVYVYEHMYVCNLLVIQRVFWDDYVPQVKEEINKLTHPNCGHFQVEWQGHGILGICQPQCSRNYIFSLFFTNFILDKTMNLYFLC